MKPLAQTKVAGIVLAAGKGTRMKSALPKCLHSVCGLPMGEYVGRAMVDAGAKQPIFVIGHGGDLLRAELGAKYEYVYQKEQLGTGHAAKQALAKVEEFDGAVLVGPGDAPLITGEAMVALVEAYVRCGADCVIATCVLPDPAGYGRIVRDKTGEPAAIVEELDASDEQRRINEVATSFYCFDAKALRSLLPKLKNDNSKKEYYLTDLVAMIAKAKGKVVTCEFGDAAILKGVNDRWQLAEASEAMRKRILRRHALNGVTLADPNTIHIGAEVEIAPETRIDAMTVIEGKTRIGSGCHIGPFCRVFDAEIADECTVIMSHLNSVRIGSQSRVGPYANLRPGTVLAERVKVGNFVEIKNADIAESASLSHLTYVGDASVGARANIGAGTITCNYDGFNKHRTVIGEDAFIGSNSTLVAPLEIGDRAVTAAGSAITKDIPADSLGIGRSRQENKEGWAKIWRKKNSSKKK
jgi:bifunctional UDP-N-acetylglucosamine pyrophosphorylase/glucosamine-1-phosphate N-acetyltransferase